ncbi:hypothetical protein [Thermomonas sp. XSG]|uniref:hypothetical protein n=1 Tax=Thermomonas sp. XSG TaxID=2771436 RepID=UPI0016804542|nr:hypothetical protein [Thermomonas sp. XSG]QNU14358.1 hypothetical protein ICG51_000587 [Thermomonas sp. XSG]
MANWFKEEIEQFGTTVDASIQKASIEIQRHVDKIGDDLNVQRTLTKTDVKELIDYAATRFGESIDTRVQTAKVEIANLVTEKVGEVRRELTAAADEQKQSAIRNATIAIGTAVAIGVLSLGYRKYLHGEIDLLFVFRATLGALAAGHIVWLARNYIFRYIGLNETQRSLVIAGTQYLGALRPKGAIGHILLLSTVAMCWLTLNFWQELKIFFHTIAG